MPSSASRRAAQVRARHRKDGRRAQAVYPTFRLEGPSPLNAPSGQPAFARHVGRVGALAVALGVGVAVATATGAGLAAADEGATDSPAGSTGASGASSSTASASASAATSATTDSPPAGSSTSTSPTETATTAGSGAASTPHGDTGSTVPEMVVSASGGANTSVGQRPVTSSSASADSTSVASSGTAPKHDRPTTPAASPGASSAVAASVTTTTPLREASTRAVAPDTVDAGTHAVETPQSSVTPVADVPTSELVAPVPSPSTTALTVVPAPPDTPGPSVPVQSPLAWTLLAWTRREAQRSVDATTTTVSNDIYATLVDTAVSGSVLDNDTAPAGDSLVVDSHTDPSHGSVTMQSDGTFTYQPQQGYVGPDEFDYTAISVGTGSSASTVVSIAVLPNQPPTAVDDSFTTSRTPFTTSATSNDSGSQAGFVVVAHTDPANGSVTMDETGVFTYTAHPGFLGEDSFTYTIADSRNQTATATVTITVVNAGYTPPPFVVGDAVFTPVDTAVSITVLANDFGFSGNPLTATVGNQPRSGVVSDDGTGTFVYTPNAGFVGVDSFTYAAADGVGGSSTATVTVNVGRYFNDPLVGRDYYDATKDTPLVVSPQWGVLSNDFDPDGDSMTAAVTQQPAYGTVVMASDGSFVYTPAAGFLGQDVFSYTATDSTMAANTTTVTITVKVAPNLPPQANFDGYQTYVGVPVTLDLLANDSDPEGAPLTARIVTKPTSGTVTTNSDGTFTYTPATGFVGTVEFRYAVSDGVNEAEANVMVTVVEENHAPTANDDAVTFPNGIQVIVDVLANDTDPEGDYLYVSDYGTPAHGTTGGNLGGTIEYTPEPDFSGTDQFTYQISDAFGNTSTATVTVTILPPRIPPTANDDTAVTAMDTPVDIDVLTNDSNPSNDVLTVAIDTPPDRGQASVAQDGTLHYTPPPGFTGIDYVSYTITNAAGMVSFASVTITVTGSDDGGSPSEPGATRFTVSTGTTLRVTAAKGVVGNDYLAQGARAGLVDGPTHGTLSLNGDGSFAYTPATGFVGTDSFTYYIGTSEWGDGPFTATVEVTPSAGAVVGVPTVEVAYGNGGLPSCQSAWLPGIYQQDDVWPLCSQPEVRRLSDRM
ncbi:tandem-95 repeat protein [Mycobacterium yunnanensis]|uniref:Tandem-95 repeat protein n=1 Tax=Mycobacterium yunnanensis TaxID=368477 RepID=A0A9X2YW23_9MYCO|nr:Ig-like domain-containing protein [Mycobacterium yunnanensis]MCV7419785.1 tandem-95 repeat protein [Mycobacterium yunnanensis]